jgi:hypothetical protein
VSISFSVFNLSKIENQYIFKERMWDQGGQPWQQWPLNQQQWMQSFQHQQDPSKGKTEFGLGWGSGYLEIDRR